MPGNSDSLLELMYDARRRLDFFCDELLGDVASEPGGRWRPPTDVFESEDRFVIKMEIGGLGPAEAEVVVEKNILTIRGVRADRCCHAKQTVHQMEIRYGAFERRVRIDAPFDREGIACQYAEGFLEVVVPKAAPPEPRKVRLQI